MSKGNPKPAGGRPAKYDPSYCDDLTKHMSSGLSFRSFTAQLPGKGVHLDTLYEWVKRYPEFAEALKRGRDLQVAFWEKLGRNAVAGKVKDFNPTTYIWMTKNLLGWRDKVDVNADINERKEIIFKTQFGEEGQLIQDAKVVELETQKRSASDKTQSKRLKNPKDLL